MAALVWNLACATVQPPFSLAGIVLSPGRYVQSSYLASGFIPEDCTYELGPVRLEDAQGVTTDKFLPGYQAELAKAWSENGLRLGGGTKACRLAIVAHRLSLQSAFWRIFLGRTSARLEVSGTIDQGDRLLFAFRDQVELASPVNPGAAPPKEAELLLQQLSRTSAQRILNEMLLVNLTGPSGGEVRKDPHQ
jgi:hypothetical protein